MAIRRSYQSNRKALRHGVRQGLLRLREAGMLWMLVILGCAALAQAQPLRVLWDQSGVGAQSAFGARIFSLGDQNDDGYADWAVSSGGTGIPGQINEPRFDLFHGGDPPVTTPYLTFAGRLIPYRELWGRQTIGDVNGDGYMDWWTQYGFGPQDDSIVVEVFWGGPDADAIADAIFGYSGDNGHSGVLPLGDFNGDGYDDFFFYDGGTSLSQDTTYIYLGGDPLDTIPDLIIPSVPQGSQSSLPRAYGDINGDGYGDFVTSTNNWPPTSFLYLGSETPDTIPDYEWPDFYFGDLTMAPDLNGDHCTDLIIGRFEAIDVHFGGAVLSRIPNYTLNFPGCDGGPTFLASAGDYNRDDYGDLVAVDFTCNQSSGGLKIYLGHPWLNPDPVLTVNGRTAPLYLVGIGTAIGLGDVNGDGIDDLAIGATNDHFDGRRGRVVILSGDSTRRVGVEDPRPELVHELTVRVYPNPFNARTEIRFDMPQTGRATLTIYDLAGREVAMLADEMFAAGEHSVAWNAAGLPSGVYFARLHAGEFAATRKLLLLR